MDRREVLFGLSLALKRLGAQDVSSRSPVQSQLLPIEIAGKFGFIDRSLKLTIKPQFDAAEPFSEGLAAVRVGRNLGYIDEKGDFVIPPKFLAARRFSEGFAVVREWSQGSGFIDKSGKYLFPPAFTAADDFSEGLARVDTGFVTAYVSRQGRTLFYIDTQKQAIIKNQPPPMAPPVVLVTTQVPFSGGIAPARLRSTKDLGDWGFIDRNGSIVVKPYYDSAESFAGGLAQVSLDGAAGYIDTKGKVVIPLAFESARTFRDGRAWVLKNGSFWYINTAGKAATPKFPFTELTTPEDFSEGLAAVANRNGKYGYVDKTGTVVIPHQFEEAGEFSGGLARVKANRKDGYIDTKGHFAYRAP